MNNVQTAKFVEIEIDGSVIKNAETFHDEFSAKLGFSEGYGRNMDAWIDCLRDIHVDTGMSKVLLPDDVSLELKITSIGKLESASPESIQGLVACTAFVNAHLAELEVAPIVLLFED